MFVLHYVFAYIRFLTDIFPFVVIGGIGFILHAIVQQKSFHYFTELDKTLASETSAWPTSTTPTFLDN